jgi:hypothetical protein
MGREPQDKSNETIEPVVTGDSRCDTAAARFAGSRARFCRGFAHAGPPHHSERPFKLTFHLELTSSLRFSPIPSNYIHLILFISIFAFLPVGNLAA